MFKCMDACTLRVGACVHVWGAHPQCTPACGSPKSTPEVFLITLHLIQLRHGLSLNVELTTLAKSG